MQLYECWQRLRLLLQITEKDFSKGLKKPTSVENMRAFPIIEFFITEIHFLLKDGSNDKRCFLKSLFEQQLLH